MYILTASLEIVKIIYNQPEKMKIFEDACYSKGLIEHGRRKSIGETYLLVLIRLLYKRRYISTGKTINCKKQE